MSEEINRDVERAEEYEQTTSRVSALGKNRFELSTGLIIAARYADKLRRVALVAFSKIAPKDVIIRDISELNKQLYTKIVEEMKLGKLDVIRIMVDAEYDEQRQKLVFTNVRIIRYLTEDQCTDKYKSLISENEQLKKEISELKKKLEDILSALK
ncbi:single- stranded DNA-binding family protein [Sulfolobus tengchongensis]|uniref:Single- stranded DNA-binding family protein n=1 Tax=Sulfolobus tengchongensis TaxID=207809 RepID=A0AAX4L2C2_9CREN